MQRAGQRSKQVQEVGQMESLKVCRMLMVQQVDQEPMLSWKAGRRLTWFAGLGLIFVVGSA